MRPPPMRERPGRASPGGAARELAVAGWIFDAVVMSHVLGSTGPIRASRSARRRGSCVPVACSWQGSRTSPARGADDAGQVVPSGRAAAPRTSDATLVARRLAALGFEARRLSYLAPEFDCFSFIQSALNLFGLPHNLLYDLLRGRAAKVLEGEGQGGRSPWPAWPWPRRWAS